MVGYYIATPRESRQFRISDKLQRSVVENASHMIFSSRWAADDAAIHYEQPTNKISIVKFGPNIDDSDITPPLTVCII
jgi:hypothetical protein